MMKFIGLIHNSKSGGESGDGEESTNGQMQNIPYVVSSERECFNFIQPQKGNQGYTPTPMGRTRTWFDFFFALPGSEGKRDDI